MLDGNLARGGAPCARRRDAGEDAATIFLVDRLARLQRAEATQEALAPATLAHYRETLALLARTHPDLPFLADVRHALRNAGQAGAPSRE